MTCQTWCDYWSSKRVPVEETSVCFDRWQQDEMAEPGVGEASYYHIGSLFDIRDDQVILITLCRPVLPWAVN